MRGARVRGARRGPAAGLAPGRPNDIIDIMAQLIVRNVDPAIVRALKLRAARHGRSAEAEHRELLRAALGGRPGRSLKDHLMAMPTVGEDADFHRRPSRARRVGL